MNIFGLNKEPQLSPTGKVNAPEGLLREVEPEAATRLEIDTKAMEKANITANSMLGFMQLSSEHVGGVVTGAVAQPVIPERAVSERSDEDIIDARLKYATFQPQEYEMTYDPVAEAEEVTRQAAARQAEQVSVAASAPMPRSEYEIPVEATPAGPQVPQEEVGVPTQLYDEVVADRAEAARQQLSNAYDLAA